MKSGSLFSSSYKNSYGNYALKLSWEETSVSVDNNTSTISWRLSSAFKELNPTSAGGLWAYVSNITLKLADKTLYTNASGLRCTGDQLITSGTFTIEHNNDGSKSITGSIACAISVSTVNSTGSATWTLTDIPRGSKISLNRTSLAYKDSVTITLTKANSSYRHNIFVGFNGKYDSTAVASNVDSTYTYNLALANATKLLGTTNYISFRVDTYNGSTFIASTTSANVSVIATDELYPTIDSVSIVPSANTKNIYDYFNSNFITGKTSAVVTPKCSAKYGASITEVRIYQGNNYKNNTATYELTKENTAIKIVAYDSRGLSRSHGINIKALLYEPPTIRINGIYRANADGTPNSSGGYYGIDITYNVTSLNGLNTKDIVLEVTPSGGDKETKTITLENYSGNYLIKGNEADTSNTYTIGIVLRDYFNSTSKVIGSISSILRVLNWYRNIALAVGGFSSRVANLFEVFWKSHFYDDVIIGTESKNANLTIVGKTSGIDYNDLENKPTIPTKTSQLTNDNGYTKGQRVTLWTNSATLSSSTSFSPQTITLSDNVNNYDEVVLVCAYSGSYPYTKEYRAINLGSSYMVGSVGLLAETHESGYAFKREWKPSGTSVQFYNCYRYSSYAKTTTTTLNTNMIPMYVIGIKY